jgi:hypothetical protein
MTNDERKAVQPLLDEVNNMAFYATYRSCMRAFTMAKDDGLGGIGFNIMFPNEWEVSVRWSNNHSCDGGKTTVEVAVFDTDDNWYTLDGRDELVKSSQDTDVMGHVTPDVLLNILQEVAKR